MNACSVLTDQPTNEPFHQSVGKYNFSSLQVQLTRTCRRETVLQQELSSVQDGITPGNTYNAYNYAIHPFSLNRGGVAEG